MVARPVRAEMRAAELWLETCVDKVARTSGGFLVTTSKGVVAAKTLVIATGGKSIPEMGATGWGYEIARQFGHEIIETRAGLVPLTFSDPTLSRLKALAGVSVEARVSAKGTGFQEGLLFTHRGLSGPSILQVSSYWREGEEISVDLAPEGGFYDWLRARRGEVGRKDMTTVLSEQLPARLVEDLKAHLDLSGNIADFSDRRLEVLETSLRHWVLKPSGSEGYRTAEVTLGGVNTDGLNARTMESRSVPGLYFIGETMCPLQIIGP